MAEYHVGCGLAEIYAGRLKKNRCEWIEKSNVLNQVVQSSIGCHCRMSQRMVNK